MASYRERRQLLVTAVLLTVALTLFLYYLSRVWDFTVDDTFITLRYARNLANGQGITFNPGEQPVEGYTTFLWMLLMAVPHFLGLPSVATAKVFGVLCTLGTLMIAFRLVSFAPGLGRGAFVKVGGALAVLFLCVNPETAVHTVSGMETALFMLNCAATALYAAQWYVERSRGDAVVLCFLILLLGLTRPEGNLIGVATLMSLLWKSNASERKQLLGTIAKWYVVPGLIYFVGRAWYFGLLFPVPFYVKVTGASLLNGLGPTLEFTRHALLPLAVPIILALWRGVGGSLLPSLLGALALILFFLHPRHLMGYEWRFIYPALIIASVYAGAGILSLSQVGNSGNPVRRVIAFTLVLLVVGTAVYRSPGIIRDKREYAEGLEKAHVQIGQQLGEIREQVAHPTLALMDVGAVGYYSDWTVIDMAGLNDTLLARRVVDPEYVLSRRLQVLVVISMDSTKFLPFFAADEETFELAIKMGFEHVWTSTFKKGYYLWVVVPRDSEITKLLRFGPA